MSTGLKANSDGSAAIQVGGSDVIGLSSTGNVGIGTTSPGQKLVATGTIESTSGGFKFPDGTTKQSNASPTVTSYTSGSGTYTTPANCKFLIVKMVGGGGGGSGSGSTGGAGGAGGNTTFGTATANGGSGGVVNSSVGGAGGAATIGSISGIAVTGGTGDSGVTLDTNNTYPKGGMGSASPLGGAGAGSGGSAAGAGGAAQANTGSGGGGAGSARLGVFAGTGGGAGAYIDGLITSPGASYSYAVGAGGTAGTAGTNGQAGGAGGSGAIHIFAYF